MECGAISDGMRPALGQLNCKSLLTPASPRVAEAPPVGLLLHFLLPAVWGVSLPPVQREDVKVYLLSFSGLHTEVQRSPYEGKRAKETIAIPCWRDKEILPYQTNRKITESRNNNNNNYHACLCAAYQALCSVLKYITLFNVSLWAAVCSAGIYYIL